MIEKIAQFTDIRCCLVVGGLSTKVFIFSIYSTA
jgi:ATP-dependent RNA helicase DDX27